MEWESESDLGDTPNFSLGSFSDLSDETDERPNFTLGSFSDDMSVDQSINEATFSIGSLDVSMASDDGNQYGGSRYQIELIRQRNIAKFNVQGYDYRVRVDPIDRDTTYNNAVQILHRMISGKYISNCYHYYNVSFL